MADSRVFSAEFRVSVAERMLNGESATTLSSELQIKRSVLYRWRDCYRKEGAAGLNRRRGRPPGAAKEARAAQQSAEAPAGTSASSSDGRVAELERRLGRLALENDFLREAFKRVKEARSKNNAPGDVRCTEK
jgi:transposase-like protein